MIIGLNSLGFDPVGSQSASGGGGGTGEGSIGTIVLSPVLGQGDIPGTGQGAIGTIILSPVVGTTTTSSSGEGSIGEINLEAIIAVANIVAQGMLGTITLTGPTQTEARTTQFGLTVLYDGSATARTTQFGAAVLAANAAITRVTQMGLMVLATGGESPIQPDPLSLQDGGRPQVLYQRMVNMYTEPTPQGPAASARYPRPGLYSAAERGGGPGRCIFTWNGFRIFVSGPYVFRDTTNIGTIDINGPCRFAYSDTECVLCANGKLYYVTQSSVSLMTQANIPTNVIDVLFNTGRFFYLTNISAQGSTQQGSQVYYSEIMDARNVDGLNFFEAAENNADVMIGGVVLVDNVIFFTSKGVEWWYASGDPNNPLYRSIGRKYDKGLAAQGTVQVVDNAAFFLANDRKIYRTAMVPIRASNFQVENELRQVTDENLPLCSAVFLSFGGHDFYILHIVGRGSWALDVGQRQQSFSQDVPPGLWYEWVSWNQPLFRVSCSDRKDFAMGDMYSGNILGVNGAQYFDLTSDPQERVVSSFAKIKSGQIKNQNVALRCARGVGLPGQPPPIVEMRFSDSEGRRWSNWIQSSLGAMGDGSDNAKAIWTQLGQIRAPGRLFEFRCSDKVFFAPYEVVFNEPRL